MASGLPRGAATRAIFRKHCWPKAMLFVQLGRVEWAVDRSEDIGSFKSLGCAVLYADTI